MAPWYGSDGYWFKKKWSCKKVQVVLNPAARCKNSNQKLFLKKAYHCRLYIEVDMEVDEEFWLSEHEFLISTLRGDFNDPNQ